MTDDEYDRIAELVNVFAFDGIAEVELLLEDAKFSPHAELANGETPLGIAVSYSNCPVVNYLRVSVDLYFPDSGGEPPIKVAYDQQDARMFKILVDAGADLNLSGWMGITVADRIREKSQKQGTE